MSASNRTTSKGGKGSKTDNKSHKSEKSDSGKNSEKQQTNRENAHNKSEDPSIKEKVRQLIEMSHRSEEEVCLALHECDNDVNLASNMLFEGMGHGEWEIRVKKKRNRQASASKQEKQQQQDDVGGAGVGGDDWDDNQQQSGGGGGSGDSGSGGNSNNNITDKDRGGRRGGGPPRSHGRSWRGRERHENERNLDEGGRVGSGGGGGDRRGRSSGSTRGPGGGRGRGGGRAGGRYPPRGNRGGGGGGAGYNKPIDTWDNSNTWDNNTNTNHTENWDDFPGTDEWSAEEYTGSLADTKVFTPSVQQTVEPEPPVPQPAPPVSVSSNVNVVGVTPSIDNAVINTGPQLQTTQLPSQSPVPIVAGTLNAAQTQYLNQLTQQNSDNIKQYGSNQTYHAQNANQVYNTSTTGTTQNYSNNQQQFGQTANTFVNSSYANVNNNFPTNSQEAQPAQQPTRAKIQRARVPPPSKIPASAVEMPGDLNSSIGYLDVQFGAMDFMSDSNSFDSVCETKFNSGNLDSQTVTSSTGNMDLNTSNQNDAYSPKTNTQSSISSALSQSLTNSESIPQTTEHLTSAYNTAPRSTAVTSATPSVVTPSGLDIGKQGESHSYSQSTTYNSYQPKTNTYNASTYSASQVTSSSYVSNQTSNSYVNSQSTTYNPPSGNTYQNAYSSTAAGSYQSNTSAAAFPSMSQATNSYPTNNQTYQQSSNQSVYGGTNATSGLTNSSNFGNTATTSQYNSYTSTSNKLSKDNTYDSNTNPVSIAQTTTPNSVTTTALSLSQTTVSVSKSTTTLAKNSNSVVSNIPPGVPPVMSTPYIMGQVPYFQPPVYSYEEMQMLQQRLPHMTTPYYDMSYQTPTTLAAVRDATLSNVGYSISDGRFTRGDNNASPVPSTLSQQTSTLTQGHQAQPILAGTAPPPYFFTAAFNTLTPNYQFGHMYTQLPTATNAHGSSSSTQYPKPAAYSSGYGNYDTLNQAQDYNKTGYVGNSQGQKGAGVNVTSTGSSGNDLSAMYGKSHAPLGKVNSYDKQGFHSGTPPPFTGALHGGQNAGLAPSGAGYTPQVYIPTLTAHQQQQLSTQMMHQPLHQDSGNSSGQRSQTSNQTKTGSKQSYQPSYWNQA